MVATSAVTQAPLWRVGEVLLRLLTAAGLAIDAYVHADLASAYNTELHTEGVLFGVEAGVAALAALLVLVTGMRLEYVFAFLVAASAFAAIMVYRYIDVGTIGPIPNMYEPVWFHEKALAAIAEGVAMVSALAGALLFRPARS